MRNRLQCVMCSAAALFLVAGSLSCAHGPDPDFHIHLTVPQLTLESPVIVKGHVSDAATGEPIPHANVYLVDLRPECWDDLRQHTARLGTANREGKIDLHATWSTKGEWNFDTMPVTSGDWVQDIRRLADVAEERCRAGDPVNAAVVVDAWPYHGRYALLDSSAWSPGPAEMVVQLGSWALEPLPEGYWCYGDLALAELVAVSPREEAP